MNITFMIGNGFDINLGLATQYKDFIDIYRNIQVQDDEIIQKFKKNIINCDLPLWSNAEMAFGKQTSCINDNFSVEDYCYCHSHFCTALAEYLKVEQKKLELSKEKLPVIAENFSKAVNNLTIGFRAVPKGQIQSLISCYSSGISFNFIDFNYTNTLDLLCSHTNRLAGWKQHGNHNNSMGKLIHVHGTVEKDMVLGVHDESQISNTECFKSYDTYYMAQLIKSQTDIINEENTYKQTLQVLASSHLIYVYGMSLGDTDKFWWEKICHMLKQSGELRVILHCYEAPENELLRTDIKRFEDKQRNKLFKLGNVEKEQRGSLQSRGHVTGTNIFKDLNNIVAQVIGQAKAS